MKNEEFATAQSLFNFFSQQEYIFFILHSSFFIFIRTFAPANKDNYHL